MTFQETLAFCLSARTFESFKICVTNLKLAGENVTVATDLCTTLGETSADKVTDDMGWCADTVGQCLVACSGLQP